MQGTETKSYVSRLEAHLQMMSRRMEELQADLATMTERNRRLEQENQELVGRGRDAEQEALRRAERIVSEAEQRVTQALTATQRRAAEIEIAARQRAEQMMGSVNVKLDQLENEAAQRLRDAQQRLGTPVDVDAIKAEAEQGSLAEAQSVRQQVNDLLALRESVINNIRQTVDGFAGQLSELERAPLMIAPPEPHEEPPPVPRPADEPGASPIVEVVVESIADFELASELEAGLGAMAGASEVRLRSLEDGIATFEVRGLGEQGVRTGIAQQFPGSELDRRQPGQLQLKLPETGIPHPAQPAPGEQQQSGPEAGGAGEPEAEQP